MPLDPRAVGATGEEWTTSWTSTDALLYAVGIGAGADDLPFVTENSTGIEQLVYPTFAVAATLTTSSGRASAMRHVGTFEPEMVVHGAQAVTLHRPIPPDGTATISDRVVAMHDKGKAAVIVIDADATLPDGALLWTLRTTTFVRNGGGFGGERGESKPPVLPPDRSPDHEVELATSPDQAYLYRLSGDRNPLHSDPEFARRAGFERPILHGLCTYGFTARALLRALCDDDVTRFHHIEGRFSAPVFPGERLTVRAWRVGDAVASYTTTVGDRTVIDQGVGRFG